METLINLISYLGVFSICIIILYICLIWLFIRSAVASGTKKGILDAYTAINSNNSETDKKPIKTSMFDDDEKRIITIFLVILIIGLIIAYTFFMYY